MKTKNIIYIAALVCCIFITLSSCDKSENKIFDYRFTADVSILDNAGTSFKVNQPVKMKISISNLVDRSSYLTLYHTAGDKKSYIYIEDKADSTFQANEILQNKFNNDFLIVNYIPKNAGIQTVTFTIKNGEYSVNVSKTFTVEAGTDIQSQTFYPLNQRLGYISTANFTINNKLDKDNFYNFVYEVINGAANMPTIVMDGKNLVPGDTIRLMSGIGTITKKLSASQLNEGKTVIRYTIIDRYKNATERTYELHFVPDVNLVIYGEASYMNTYTPFATFSMWTNSLPVLYFSINASTSKSYTYNIQCDKLVAEFDYSYNRRTSNKRTEWVTEHVTLPISKGKSSGTYYILKGLTPTEVQSQPLYCFASPGEITNFKLTGANDTDGRVYILNTKLVFTETWKPAAYLGDTSNTKITNYTISQ